MTVVVANLSKIALHAVLIGQTCCSQGAMSESEFDTFCSERLASAKKLTNTANDLLNSNRTLAREIKICQTITSPDAPPQKFSSVLDSYQDARKKYLEHREQYDLHVKEFHQQAKADKRALPVLAVPNVTPIATAAEDACEQLQALEQQLKSSESELCNMIQLLQKQKGKIPENTYFQNWLETQTLATNVQSGALQFNRGVTSKGLQSSNRIHAASDAANVSGDYVQSKKVYAFIQAATAIENEETKRAHMHSTLASQCFIYINALNPNSTNDDGSSTITADQLVKESNALQTEYDDLQSKYSSMQNANPGHN